MGSYDDPEERAKLLEEAKRVLASLSDRERRVLRERFNIDPESRSLEEIAQGLDAAQERIAEVERNALVRLRKRNTHS